MTLPPAAGWAIDRDLSFEQMQRTYWTVRDGAPAYVQMMAQTDDGFLWFGTGSGLVRFDGVQFERYRPASGEALPQAPIRSLLALPGNALLIGWTFGGATLLRDGRVTHYGEKDGYPPGTTYQFLVDGTGRLWTATSAALARFEGERWHRIGAEWNFAGQRALAIFLDRDGTMGAFTDQSLMLLPKGANAFRPTSGVSTTRSPIVQSRDGTYYLSADRGIHSFTSLEKYDRMDRPLVAKAEVAGMTKIIVDRDGALWFGSPRGVGRIAHPDRRDARVEYFAKSDEPTDAEASVVFEDREGSIWTATPGGIDRFRLGSFLSPAGPMRVSFPAMIPDAEGGLWFAKFGGGLRHATRQGIVSTVGSMQATCAYRDPQGVGWYGSLNKGPEVLRHEKGRLERVALPPELPRGVEVQAIATDASGALWISAIRKGVYRLAGGTWSQPPELPDAGTLTALVITADWKGRVWLGYLHNRVALWENGSARLYSSADQLEVGHVTAIQVKGTHVWVAGERGLALFASGRFHPMSTAEPNVLMGVTGLVETDEGDLWLHATSGAILLRASEVRKAIQEPNYPMVHRLFNDDDGLSGVPTEVRPLPTLVAASDGRLWFGTNRGVFALDPRRLVTNKEPPSVVITAAVSGSTRFIAPARLELPALASGMQIDYTSTSLVAPRRIRFRYKLDGVDQDWQDAGARRQAFYTNLGPGSYRFQVIAANEDSVWNRTGAAFAFTIAPAWYQTKWFLALCALAVVAASALLFRVRMARMQAQIQGRLQERVLERERIARELHDTLLQGFQGLVLRFQAAMQRIPVGEPAREQMEKALERADAVLAEGRDRVRDLRNSASFQGDLPTALKEAADDLAPGHDARFALSVHGTARALHPVVVEEAYRIAREALANAYYHAAARNIEIEMDYAAAQLRIRIRDDGKGIDGQVLANGGVPGHWGMSGMRERAQKLGARLLIRSGDGSGTDIELDIPAAVAYSSP